MSDKALRTILEVVMRQALVVWEDEGMVTGVCWQAGHGRAVFSVADTAEGYQDDDLVIMVQAVIANHYDSQYIGSVDEVFAKEYTGQPADPDIDLATLAETDPSVSTAVCVEGLCRKTGVTLMHMALLKLDDDGSPTWEVVTLDETEHRGMERARRAHEKATELGAPMDPEELMTFLDDNGWAASVADNNVWSLLC